MPEIRDVTWRPTDAVETRKYQMVVEERAADATGARLSLVGDGSGETRLLLQATPEEVVTLGRELHARGYRGSSCTGCGAAARTSGWRGFLNELDATHIAIETLDWSLSDEEKRALDAVDAYGRRAPTGFRSRFLPNKE